MIDPDTTACEVSGLMHQLSQLSTAGALTG